MKAETQQPISGSNEDLDVLSKAKISETAIEKTGFTTGDMPKVGDYVAPRPGTTECVRLPPKPALRARQSAGASA